MEGYIKIHRQIVDWEWWGDNNMLTLWLYLLIYASPKDTMKFGKEIGRGELVTTMSELSEKTGLSIQSLRTCLERLLANKQICVKSTNKNTHITICKYGVYQDAEESEQQTNLTESNKRATNEQQTGTNCESVVLESTIITNSTESNKQELFQKKEKENPPIPPKRNNKESEEENKELSNDSKKKEEETIIYPTKKKPELDWSVVPQDFIPIVQEWLAYKKEKQHTYKPIGFRTFVKSLLKLSDGKAWLAREIIEQSEANNWDGIFPLKNKYNGNRTNSAEQRQAERAAKFQEILFG